MNFVKNKKIKIIKWPLKSPIIFNLKWLPINKLLFNNNNQTLFHCVMINKLFFIYLNFNFNKKCFPTVLQMNNGWLMITISKSRERKRKMKTSGPNCVSDPLRFFHLQFFPPQRPSISWPKNKKTVPLVIIRPRIPSFSSLSLNLFPSTRSIWGQRCGPGYSPLLVSIKLRFITHLQLLDHPFSFLFVILLIYLPPISRDWDGSNCCRQFDWEAHPITE